MDFDILCSGALVGVLSVMIYLLSDKITNLLWRKELDPNHHGGELVAEVLQAHDVKNIFTLVGGHISPILVGAEQLGIRVIDTRQEVTAVFAADAMARITGNIGVAVVTAGPGVTNTITAIKNAQMAQSPVLLIGGAAPTLLKGRGALQDIDQLSLFTSLCKYSTSILTVRDIIPVIRKAIQIAMSDTPGPVFVEIPVNVLYPLDVVKKEVDQSKGGKSIFGKIIHWYLDWHVYNIFVDGFETQDTSPLPVKCPLASDAELKKALKILSKCTKPVLVMGSQAMLPPSSAEHLQMAVGGLGMPCFLGGMSRGLLSKFSDIHLKHTRKEVLKEAEVVILAGATCDFRLSYGKVLSKSSKVIVINRNKNQMLQNSDVFWKPTLAIEGCASDFLIRLAKWKIFIRVDQDWLSQIALNDTQKEEANREKALCHTQKYLNPVTVLTDVDRAFGENVVFVADGGDFVATASYILKPRGPLRWLDPGPFGTLGVGAGFAIAAKLCYPSSDVVIIYGDGSLGYSLIEFDTFVRHKLPVIAVVGNDACWTQIAREQAPLFNSMVACTLDYSNYHTAVDGFGAKGILVNTSEEEMLKDLLVKAIETSRMGVSVLVNVLISPSSFRQGSISV